MIIEICDKDGSRKLQEHDAQKLWLDSIEKIYVIKQGVTEAKEIEQTDLDNFHKFLLTRI